MQTIIQFLLSILILIISTCTLVVKYLWWIVLLVVAAYGFHEGKDMYDVIWELFIAGISMVGVMILGVVSGLISAYVLSSMK